MGSALIYAGLNALFFMCAHPHLFIWGQIFLFAWVLLFITCAQRKKHNLLLLALCNLRLGAGGVVFAMAQHPGRAKHGWFS